eukprot:EC726473.1.p1 GENE.EC726473.1~~EC726473.1.p1  ORF type:complete len:84 (+),score=1.13 EC726473.1:41-292(+)
MNYTWSVRASWALTLAVGVVVYFKGKEHGRNVQRRMRSEVAEIEERTSSPSHADLTGMVAQRRDSAKAQSTPLVASTTTTSSS